MLRIEEIYEFHYILKDHLGSWTVVADEDGVLEQELSYDAWGNQRDPDTWCVDATIRPMFDRGFTGHEHLPNFGLVNMDGRMYAPVMSSFLSVDRYVQDPGNSQGFNRYAYCMYNPLRYTDPTGWQMIGGNKPRNPFHDDWSVSHVQPVFEPSDFRNAYHLVNQAFYDADFSGGNLGGCAFAAAVDYYNSRGPGEIWVSDIQTIWNFVINPCYNTRKTVINRGLTDYTLGYSFGEDGLGIIHIDYFDNQNINHIVDVPTNFHTSGFCDYASMSINLSVPVERTTFTYVSNNIGFAPFNYGDTYNNFQQSNYKMVYNAIINPQTNNLYVNASSYNTTVLNASVKASAKATLLIDGGLVESKCLQYDGGTIITPPNCNNVGSASFVLPENGSVSLIMEGGWYLDYSSGVYIPTKNHWASPITINANHTFFIRR